MLSARDADVMTVLTVNVAHQQWPLREPFVISRGTKTNADVVVVTVTSAAAVGHGEAVPYARYGETVDAVMSSITDAVTAANGSGLADLRRVVAAMPAGAARNALDCALWDYQAKHDKTTVRALVGSSTTTGPVITAFTLSLGSPEQMAAKALAVPHLPLLKLKLGGGDLDAARMTAVRAARPDARLIADANEAWSVDSVAGLLDVAAALSFEVIEQPLPADADALLQAIPHPVPVCADESVHTADDVASLVGRYDAVNIKLDKAGGLTGALGLLNAARASGLKVMAGSMVATSLAIAPQLLIADTAEWVDVDGPLLLQDDRPFAIAINGGKVSAPDPRLWG